MRTLRQRRRQQDHFGQGNLPQIRTGKYRTQEGVEPESCPKRYQVDHPEIQTGIHTEVPTRVLRTPGALDAKSPVIRRSSRIRAAKRKNDEAECDISAKKTAIDSQLSQDWVPQPVVTKPETQTRTNRMVSKRGPRTSGASEARPPVICKEQEAVPRRRVAKRKNDYDECDISAKTPAIDSQLSQDWLSQPVATKPETKTRTNRKVPKRGPLTPGASEARPPVICKEQEAVPRGRVAKRKNDDECDILAKRLAIDSQLSQDWLPQPVATKPETQTRTNRMVSKRGPRTSGALEARPPVICKEQEAVPRRRVAKRKNDYDECDISAKTPAIDSQLSQDWVPQPVVTKPETQTRTNRMVSKRGPRTSGASEARPPVICKNREAIPRKRAAKRKNDGDECDILAKTLTIHSQVTQDCLPQPAPKPEPQTKIHTEVPTSVLLTPGASESKPPVIRIEQEALPLRRATKRKNDRDICQIPAKTFVQPSWLFNDWIPNLGLNLYYKYVFYSPYGLPYGVCLAATTVLQKQFKAVPNAPSVRFVCDDITPVSGPTVQVHACLIDEHAFVSCYLGGKVMVADPALRGQPNFSASIWRQLTKSYPAVVKNPNCNIKIINVQAQPLRDRDCVTYAIANAYELLIPDGNPTCQYRRKQMRLHLEECLQNGVITEFPKIYKPITYVQDGFSGLKKAPWK